MCEVNNNPESSIKETISTYYETVDALILKGKEAIEEGEYGQAVDILIQLDQGHCQGKTSLLETFDLLETLWKKDPREGKKLLEIPFRTFTLFCVNKTVKMTPSDYSAPLYFVYNVDSSPHGKEALQDAFVVFKEGNDSLFKSKVSEILELYTNEEISDKHLSKFIGNIAMKNIVEAYKFFPLFEKYANMNLQNTALSVQIGTKCNDYYSNEFLFLDADKGLQMISKEANAEKKIAMSISLARLHPSKVHEALNLAKEEIANLEDDVDRIRAITALAEALLNHQCLEEYKIMVNQFPQVFQNYKHSIISAGKATHFFLLAGTDLLEKNQANFNTNLKIAKEALEEIQQIYIKKGIEKDIKKLEKKAEAVFGPHELELHTKKA